MFPAKRIRKRRQERATKLDEVAGEGILHSSREKKDKERKKEGRLGFKDVTTAAPAYSSGQGLPDRAEERGYF